MRTYGGHLWALGAIAILLTSCASESNDSAVESTAAITVEASEDAVLGETLEEPLAGPSEVGDSSGLAYVDAPKPVASATDRPEGEGSVEEEPDFDRAEAIAHVDALAAAFENVDNAIYAEEEETYIQTVKDIVWVLDPALLDGTVEVAADRYYECTSPDGATRWEPNWDWVSPPIYERHVEHVDQFRVDDNTWVVRARFAASSPSLEIDTGFSDPIDIVVTRDGVGPTLDEDAGQRQPGCLPFNSNADDLAVLAIEVLSNPGQGD